MTLGETMQQLRKSAGISQEELAQQMDVSRHLVAEWERNETPPEPDKLERLGTLFSVSADALLGGGEEADEPPPDLRTLERLARMNHANKQMATGFKTVVLGLCMLVVEYMMLPLIAMLQRGQAGWQGYAADFGAYTKMQPMPTVFWLTAIVIALGALSMLVGLRNKRNQSQSKKP